MKSTILLVCFSGLVFGNEETCKGNENSCIAPGDEVNLMQTNAQVHLRAVKEKLKLAQDVNYPPYAYKDAETGELKGFGHDIAVGMSPMCADFEIEVVETKWGDCWTPTGLGARLENGEIDACMTYTHTKGLRNQFADFSYGILDVNKAAGLLVLLDANGNPKVTGSDDLSGKKVVDVGGWAPTADGLDYVENKCTGQNYASDYKLVMATGAANNNDLALSMLLNGTVDAMFVYSDQAKNYKKACAKGPSATINCDLWKGFGTKFAYVQTGQFGYVNNGTTLALAKKGSGVPEKLNPCLQKFMETKDYYDICVKYDFVDSCYRNSFFPSSGDIVKKAYNIPTNEQKGEFRGYCPCPSIATLQLAQDINHPIVALQKDFGNIASSWDLLKTQPHWRLQGKEESKIEHLLEALQDEFEALRDHRVYHHLDQLDQLDERAHNQK
jgi:ABC-type amino acid transport substrate-binding protein